MATLTRRVDRGEPHDLARRVRNFLEKQTELSHLDVEVRHDEVIVRGRVTSDTARILITHCCQRVAGVRRVLNETVVDQRK